MKEIIYINSREDARQFSNCSAMTVKQLDIFGSQPQFKGETFVPERDGERLKAQLGRVRNVTKDGQWRTLRRIADLTGDPEASVSARLRQLRKEGLKVKRRY